MNQIREQKDKKKKIAPEFTPDMNYRHIAIRLFTYVQV